MRKALDKIARAWELGHGPSPAKTRLLQQRLEAHVAAEPIPRGAGRLDLTLGELWLQEYVDHQRREAPLWESYAYSGVVPRASLGDRAILSQAAMDMGPGIDAGYLQGIAGFRLGALGELFSGGVELEKVAMSFAQKPPRSVFEVLDRKGAETFKRYPPLQFEAPDLWRPYRGKAVMDPSGSFALPIFEVGGAFSSGSSWDDFIPRYVGYQAKVDVQWIVVHGDLPAPSARVAPVADGRGRAVPQVAARAERPAASLASRVPGFRKIRGSSRVDLVRAVAKQDRLRDDRRQGGGARVRGRRADAGDRAAGARRRQRARGRSA